MIPERKLELRKRKAQENCRKCNGKGCESCASKKNRLNGYARAGIPLMYWDLAFKDFQGDKRFAEKIRDVINNIDDFYEEGKSLAFIGNLGTGKSYAACCVLKKAVVSKYDCHYTQMAEIVNSMLSGEVSSSKLLDKLVNVDFLVIDEYDLRWIYPSEKVEKMFGKTLEYVLRTRFQNGMPTILCSNADNIDNVLNDDFGRALSSLRSMYMDVLVVSGKDFRKNVKS